MSKDMTITFWGVRGTLPVPGEKSLRYGGNTSCLTLQSENSFFIFDAGTGIKELSNELLLKNKFPISAKIFLTHPHYDHINGLPFFAPFYMEDNEFEIIGVNQKSATLKELIEGQMDAVYFPVTMNVFPSTVIFKNIESGHLEIDHLRIDTITLNHPGHCIGYRVSNKDKSFCYITDNEIYFKDCPSYDKNKITQLIEFISGTDVLVIDSTYLDSEYEKKVGWGHSCVTQVAEIANQAKVKLLCLFHHDPDQTDDDIDEKLKVAQSYLTKSNSITECIAPKERDVILIP